MSPDPAGPARRIVSLTCSNTEIVAALGCGDRLVGVDDHSDHPPELLDGLPRVGPDLGIEVEKVKALEPDLVLASLTVPGHEKVVESIARVGLRHIAPAPRSVEDIYRDIREIAALLGVEEKGEAVVAEMESALVPRATAEAPGHPDRPLIAVQWWPKPVILPGRLSWVHDLVVRAGGRHPGEAEEVESRPFEDAEIAALDPDAIVLSWCGVEPARYRPDVVYRNPAWSEVKALRERRVVTIPEGWLGRPSPRLADGYRALCELVDRCRAEAG